jgi:hypothetical protein
MSVAAIAILALVPSSSADRLVAWFPLDGSAVEVLSNRQGKLEGGAHWSTMGGRTGAEFGGMDGVVRFKDQPAYRLGAAFSIYAEVWIHSDPRGGSSPAGQIVFRGDDRNGLDNYSLSLGTDGLYTFAVYGPGGEQAGVRAAAERGRWEALLATFDSRTRRMRLVVDGAVVAEQSVAFVPVLDMVEAHAPGLSFGNVQNPMGGRHWQPFHGLVRQVRLYAGVADWEAASRPPRTGPAVRDGLD